MKRKVFYGFLGLSLLILCGCGKADLKDGSEIAASIKGYKISADELYNELKTKGGTQVMTDMIDEYIANKEIKTTDEIKEAAEANLEQLKAQYEQYKMDFNEALKQGGYSSEEALLKDLITDEKKSKVVEKYLAKDITDKEIKDYYETEITGEITARHILIKPDVEENASEEDTAAAEKKAMQEAEKLIKELDKGADFEKLAKKYSDDEGTASEGGLFSDFSKEDVVTEFWDASTKLKDGEYTKEPVKSEYGYHIILKVSETDKPKLKDVKDDVIDALVKEKKDENANAETEIWAKIREDYNLKIKDSYLKKAYKKSIKTDQNEDNKNAN